MTVRLFFTDLDGTFLDHRSYCPAGSVWAARALVEAGVQVVFCSSKTYAEQAAIAEKLGLDVSMIVENGSAIHYRDRPEKPDVLGCDIGTIRRAASEVEAETGIRLHLISQLPVAEVVRLTGLAPMSARRAQQRRYSDTVVEPSDPASTAGLSAAFARHGVEAVLGTRFLGLHGMRAGKGLAVRRVVERFRGRTRQPVLTGAVGDGWNDLSMLEQVDLPYLVESVGEHRPVVSASRLIRVDAPGPPGFTIAALDFLSRSSTARSRLPATPPASGPVAPASPADE
jgi:mannosyl-3-phosphoglycerate phosphatase